MANSTSYHRVVAIIMSALGTQHHHITDLIDDKNQRWPVGSVRILIENNRGVFYTDVGGKVALVRVRNDGFRWWLQTEADGYPNNNLLMLPRRQAA